MLKIAICDDRKEDRDRMNQYVQKFCQERMLQAEIKAFDHPDVLICECEKLRPHIYILDIVMPMVNGIQAARELRWNQPDAQIILLHPKNPLPWSPLM
ncbi:response regulator [Sporofaciens sp. SGI.106]|uniref:response regulator n=1 Tax=Sporofaciens sp. SGI.106 TaxID=3420568 RepID=UPI003D06264D